MKNKVDIVGGVTKNVKKAHGFWKEFKEFAFKGNVIDLAVGVMIGSAFGKITTSLVNDVFMPILAIFFGKVQFSDLFVSLDGNRYATLADAEAAGASVLKYGSFIQTFIDFLIIAFIIFLFVKFITKLREKMEKDEPAEPAPEPRRCPYCFGEIDDRATRCPHCTSELPTEEK